MAVKDECAALAAAREARKRATSSPARRRRHGCRPSLRFLELLFLLVYFLAGSLCGCVVVYLVACGVGGVSRLIMMVGKLGQVHKRCRVAWCSKQCMKPRRNTHALI